jgi:GNAT superfamily N-acetyltransferase
MMVIRRPTPAGLPEVLAVLREAQDWLHGQGYDQWPDGSPNFGPERVGAQIGRGEFWLAADGRGPVATIAVSREGDPGFWTPAELAEPAVYLSKAAVVRRRAGEGIGALMLRWAGDKAARGGAKWLRLDAWRTNTALHAYYRSQGWAYLRTEHTPGRNSGALFQRPAVEDPQARAALLELPLADWSHGEVEQGWEHGTGSPPGA